MNNPSITCHQFLIFDTEEEYDEYIAAAINDFQAACRIALYDPIPVRNMAAIFKHSGDLKNALAFATEAIRLAPTESGHYFYRANIYDKLGNKALADIDHFNANKLRMAGGDLPIKRQYGS